MKPEIGKTNDFYLDKWYLDIVTDEGEAMIFYAARLRWHRFECQYTSWLHYRTVNGVQTKSRFTKVHFPEKSETAITWSDPQFGIAGRWDTLSEPVCTRLFESAEGYLDWNCWQPSSRVELDIEGLILIGKGYAEQLTVTLPPWKLNLDQLRWGRYGLPGHNFLWIEWKGSIDGRWVWHNGQPISNCVLEDGEIDLPETGEKLRLDRGVTLESEKRVLNLMAKLICYLPGIDTSVSMKFLMANETKWLSRGVLEKDGKIINLDFAIHELVTF